MRDESIKTETIRCGLFARRHIREILRLECQHRYKVTWIEDWLLLHSVFIVTGPTDDLRQIKSRIDYWLCCN